MRSFDPKIDSPGIVLEQHILVKAAADLTDTDPLALGSLVFRAQIMPKVPVIEKDLRKWSSLVGWLGRRHEGRVEKDVA